jgi:hypothetical protein
MITKKNKVLFIILFISVIAGWTFYALTTQFSYLNSDLYNMESNSLNQFSDNFKRNLFIYFDEIESELYYYSNLNFTKEILKQNLTLSLNAAKNQVERNSALTMKELDNYLIFNRDSSLNDIKKSHGFRNLIISDKDKTYSGLIDSNSNIIFHPNPNFENKKLDASIVGQNFLDVYNKITDDVFMYNFTRLGEESKITYLRKSNLKMADGTILILFTVTPLNNYKEARIPERENNLSQILNLRKDYDDIMIISKEGYILYSENELMGINSNDFLGFNSSSKINKNKTTFLGAFYNFENKLRFFFAQPIYSNSKYLGASVISVKPESIYSLITRNKKYNSFLVNKNWELISPLDDLTISTQKISVENVPNCFNKLKSNGSLKYKNVYGKDVLGNYIFLKDYELCLFVESSLEELNKNYTNIQKKYNPYLSLFISLIIIFTLHEILSKFKLKRKKEKRKKKKKNKMIEKIKNIDSYNYTLISLIFIFTLFFILNYLIFDYSVQNFLKQFFDFSIIFFMLILIKYTSKYKNNERTFFALILIFSTRLLILLFHFMEISNFLIFEQYILRLIFILHIIPIALLLNGFRRIFK